MKITIITPVFPFPKRGKLDLLGLERYVENLAKFLKKLGNDVKIVTTYWNGGKRYGFYKGIPILRIIDSKAIFGRIGSIFQMHFITFGLNLYIKRNFKFFNDSDIIIFNLSIGFIGYFKIKQIPILTIFHHYVPVKSFQDFLTIPFYHYLEKKQFKSGNSIIAVSSSSKKALIRYYGIDRNKILVVPNGVDTAKFNPSNFSTDVRKRYGNNILLYSGLMINRKKIPVLLKALTGIIKEIPDVHLILTGRGPLLNPYKNLANSLGIDKYVTFLGFVQDKELLMYYASSDLFVFPSELEGFGQVILEAMASGTPVICANKPPMSKIIGNGGITFKLNDPQDLAIKVIELLKNREKLRELRENALKLVKNYAWSSIAKVYIDYFNSIIKYK